MNLSDNPRGATMCFSQAGVGIGSTATQVKIAASNGAGVDYAIKGIMYHKADAASIAITAATAQAVSTSCIYLICLNSSGTLSTVKGTEVTTADVTAGNTPLEWPAHDDDVCPIGAVRIDTSATVTFTAGTTELSATGITDTYYDLAVRPATPITS